MRRHLLMIAVVGMLAGCISGRPHQDTVTDPSGNTTDCIEINTGAVVTGNVSNAGTLTGAGGARILVDPGATVNGAIVNTGTLSGTTLGIADTGLITGASTTPAARLRPPATTFSSRASTPKHFSAVSPTAAL